jgi:UMF1 family MFS transporter
MFSIPMLLNVPEIARKDGGRGRETILQSYKALWGQLKSLRAQAPETFKFLVSSAIYRDGLAGVFTFGAVLGSLAFGFSQTQIILFGIAANIVAGVGAAIGGRLDDVIGSRSVIIGSLVGLIIAGSGVFIFAGEGVITYWIGGLLLCLFVGPAQASSRTFVSRSLASTKPPAAPSRFCRALSGQSRLQSAVLSPAPRMRLSMACSA